MKNQNNKRIFRKVGGSFQLLLNSPAELEDVLALDPALWAALSAPASVFQTDAKFMQYLEQDGNGMIRLDDVQQAVRFLDERIADWSVLNDVTAVLAPEALTGKPAGNTMKERLPEVLPEVGETVTLQAVSARIGELTGGGLRGDGILRSAAVPGQGAGLFNAMTKSGFCTVGADGTTGVTAGDLEKFKAAVADRETWEKNVVIPRFREQDPAPYYQAFKALEDKLTEYFRNCQLLKLDSINAERFQVVSGKLPPLEITNGAAVAEYMASAPLAKPMADEVLLCDESLWNPVYTDKLRQFFAVFGNNALTAEAFRSLQSELAAYGAYLAERNGGVAGKLGLETVSGLIVPEAEEVLKKSFEADQSLSGKLAILREWERLLLYKAHLFELVNNFVNLTAFFRAGGEAMLKAGSLVMDGRHFDLLFKIKDVAAHKKLMADSNLCLFYVSLFQPGTAEKENAVVVVTGGSTNRLYPGKGGIFIGRDGKCYNVTLLDFVNGPVSFVQSVFQPFKRIGSVIGSKFQKLTDFTETEKKLTDAVQTGQSGGLKSMFAGNPALLMFGGVSLAALGTSAAYILKTLKEISLVHVLIALGVIFLVIFLPLSIAALFKLWRRDLGRFLDASGWTINLPMRLSAESSKFFTYRPAYLKPAKFDCRDVCAVRSWKLIRWIFYLLILTMIGLGIYGYVFWWW